MDTNILALYDRFVKGTILDFTQYGFKLEKFQIDPDVTLNLSTIHSIFEKHRVIQLRPYLNQKVLIVGCGNNPCFDLDFIDDETGESYRDQHIHNDAATIDPDIARNPTVVAFFGYQELPMFPDGAFDKIYFEGFCFEPEEGDALDELGILTKQLYRLLNEGGKFYSNQNHVLTKRGPYLIERYDGQDILTVDTKPSTIVNYLYDKY